MSYIRGYLALFSMMTLVLASVPMVSGNALAGGGNPHELEAAIISFQAADEADAGDRIELEPGTCAPVEIYVGESSRDFQWEYACLPVFGVTAGGAAVAGGSGTTVVVSAATLATLTTVGLVLVAVVVVGAAAYGVYTKREAIADFSVSTWNAVSGFLGHVMAQVSGIDEGTRKLLNTLPGPDITGDLPELTIIQYSPSQLSAELQQELFGWQTLKSISVLDPGLRDRLRVLPGPSMVRRHPGLTLNFSGEEALNDEDGFVEGGEEDSDADGEGYTAGGSDVTLGDLAGIDVESVIETLVESGEISEEDAQELLEQLVESEGHVLTTAEEHLLTNTEVGVETIRKVLETLEPIAEQARELNQLKVEAIRTDLSEYLDETTRAKIYKAIEQGASAKEIREFIGRDRSIPPSVIDDVINSIKGLEEELLRFYPQ